MKKYIIFAFMLAFAFLLVGCETSTEDTKDVETVLIDSASTSKVSTAKLGETCGGAIAKVCEPELECQFNPDFADARGRCVESVVLKDLECPGTKAPVCGIKEGQKNGYLNECEARRHGAEVIHEGFCKIDESVIGNCEAKAVGIGTCFKVTRGFEFDGKKCTERNIGGCDAEIPFPSKILCEDTCLE